MTAVTADDLMLLREYRRRARVRGGVGPVSLAAFVEATAAVQLEDWQRIICQDLTDALETPGARLLIHGPPQHGKSLIISQRFPAWAVGQHPTLRVRVACYNVTHAERFGRVNLDILRDATVAPLLPGDAWHVPAVAPSGEWSTAARRSARDANPSFVALGLGTGFTGLGADLVILDDPYKNAQEARSPAVNAMLWDWWTQVVEPRLNPDTRVIVMFHRWWEGDFAGRLIEAGGWRLRRFPALADGGADDPTGRVIGEPLSPRFDAAYLATKRQALGTAFAALYQGSPVPSEGGLFKGGAARFVDAAPEDATLLRRWDVAATHAGGDATVGVLMALHQGRCTVADVVRGQWGPDERDAAILATAARDGKRVAQVLPQDPGAAGKAQAQAFVRLLAGYSVRTVRESGDKVVRADPFASQWNAGTIAVVRGAWNRAFLDELLAFPYGQHDDQVDAASGAFAELAARGGGSLFR